MNQKLLLCFVIIIIVIFIVSNNSELFTDVIIPTNVSANLNDKAYTISLMLNNEQYDLLTFTQLSSLWKKTLMKHISAIDDGSLLKIIQNEYAGINSFVNMDKPIIPTHDFVIAIKNNPTSDIANGYIAFNSNNDPIYTQDLIRYDNSNNKKLTINNNILVATEKTVESPSIVLSEGNQISGKYIKLIDLSMDTKSIYFIKLVNTDNGVKITKITKT